MANGMTRLAYSKNPEAKLANVTTTPAKLIGSPSPKSPKKASDRKK
jgi:hypothetical protein